MKDIRFKKAIQDIREISMTSSEKEAIMKRITHARFSAVEVSPALSARGPWTVYSFSAWIQSHRAVTALAILAIVAFGGSSVVSASYSALPGDALYGMKINVSEPIKLAFAITDAAEADVRAELLQQRLQEAEILAARGSYDESKEKEINGLVDEQMATLSKVVDKVREKVPEKADDIQTTLEASMNAHSRLMAALMPITDLPVVSVTASIPADTAAGVSMVTAPAAQMMSISAPSAESAAAKQIEQQSEQVVAPQMSDKASKRLSIDLDRKKASVASLIQETTADLAATGTDPVRTHLDEVLDNGAKENLDHAKNKLDESISHDEQGNQEEAYSALLDSERAAKEASIYVKAKTRLDKEVKKEEIGKPEKILDREPDVKGGGSFRKDRKSGRSD